MTITTTYTYSSASIKILGCLALSVLVFPFSFTETYFIETSDKIYSLERLDILFPPLFTVIHNLK